MTKKRSHVLLGAQPEALGRVVTMSHIQRYVRKVHAALEADSARGAAERPLPGDGDAALPAQPASQAGGGAMAHLAGGHAQPAGDAAVVTDVSMLEC